MSKVLFALIILVGIINFLPVMGILSAARLESAYGVELLNTDLIILMRHRALLFGILGAFIIYSAFKPVFRTAAMIMAGVSMAGFVVLAHLTGVFNDNLYNIVLADYVGLFLLAVAAVINRFDNHSSDNA